MTKLKCPVCKRHTIEGLYDICSVCYWEYDPYDIRNPELVSSCNHISLQKAKSNYRKYGISDLKYINKVVK